MDCLVLVLIELRFGELGLGDDYDKYVVPTKLDFFDNYDILSIHCINSRTFVNTNNGLYVFGWNYFRQLRLEDNKNCNTPNKLDFFDDYEIVTICGGSYHTIIQTKTEVFGFGGNEFGQLGLDDTSRQFLPTKLNFFDDYEIISVECGYRHSIVITTKGVYVFGDNGCGQLGLGEDFSLHKTVPTKLNFFDKHQILLITCYADHNMIYTTQGLYVFGENFCGELGLGDRNIRRVPVKLNFEHEIILLINKSNIRIKSSHSFI